MKAGGADKARKLWAELIGTRDFVELKMPSGHVVACGIVIVTQAIAQRFLARNRNNRKLKAGLVQSYGWIMDAGQWHLAPDPIVFDEDGVFINGQHRMQAVATDTNRSIAIIAYVGWPSSGTVVVMDRGAVRTYQDVMQLGTGRHVNNSDLAVMKMIAFGYCGVPQIVGTNIGLRLTAEQLLVLEKLFMPRIESVASAAKGVFRNSVVLSVAVKASFHNADEAIKEFLSLGDTVVARSDRHGIAIRFREWLKHFLESGSGGWMMRTKIGETAARSIDAFLRNESLTKVTSTKIDPFPLPEAIRIELYRNGMAKNPAEVDEG